jgi:hypothetical protein
MQLYRVRSTVDEIEGCKNVLLTWLAAREGQPPVPYAEAIEGLAPGTDPDTYQRMAVDELFTRKEAEALVLYLAGWYTGHSTVITEEPLPLGPDVMAMSAVPLGGGVDHMMPVIKRDYPLPFMVYGYYDLRWHWDEGDSPPDPFADYDFENEAGATSPTSRPHLRRIK